MLYNFIVIIGILLTSDWQCLVYLDPFLGTNFDVKYLYERLKKTLPFLLELIMYIRWILCELAPSFHKYIYN